jgi:ribosomal protein S27AE
MRKYNIEDVLSTEELYLKIRAWAPEAMPKVFPLTATSSHCGTCGYNGKMRTGRDRHMKNKVYRQNSCPKCGSWQPVKKEK